MPYALLLMPLQIPGNPEQSLYAQGVLGIAVVALTVALLRLFKIVLNDRDKAIQQRDQLLDKYFTEVLPAFNDNSRFLQEVTDVIKENTRVLSRVDSQGGR